MKIISQKSKNFKKIFLGIIIFIIIFAFLNIFQKDVRNFFYLISSPIQKGFWQIGDRVSGFFETILEIKNLKKENEELKLKNQELLSQIVELKELKRENEILREALEIGLEKEFKLAFGKVIGKDPISDFILIDKGSEDNILKGLPVITQQKVLFGKIDEVYKNFSKVMLISHKESVFDARIEPTAPPDGKEEIFGVVKGKGDLEIFFDLIPSEVEIKEGDTMVTSALEGVYPKGLLVGEIKKVKKSDIKPFQQAEIKPFFDITKIEYLFIILK